MTSIIILAVFMSKIGSSFVFNYTKYAEEYRNRFGISGLSDSTINTTTVPPPTTTTVPPSITTTVTVTGSPPVPPPITTTVTVTVTGSPPNPHATLPTHNGTTETVNARLPVPVQPQELSSDVSAIVRDFEETLRKLHSIEIDIPLVRSSNLRAMSQINDIVVKIYEQIFDDILTLVDNSSPPPQTQKDFKQISLSVKNIINHFGDNLLQLDFIEQIDDLVDNTSEKLFNVANEPINNFY